MKSPKYNLINRLTACCLAVVFTLTPPVAGQAVYGQTYAQGIHLPQPGTMVTVSPAYTPPMLKGIIIHPENPFQFDFILDSGDTGLNGDGLKAESEKLIKYFLTSLTLPEDDLWVNLSPYEKNRIIPDEFGKTEMGPRDIIEESKKTLTAPRYQDLNYTKSKNNEIVVKNGPRLSPAGLIMFTVNLSSFRRLIKKIFIRHENILTFVRQHNLPIILIPDHGVGEKEADEMKSLFLEKFPDYEEVSPHTFKLRQPSEPLRGDSKGIDSKDPTKAGSSINQTAGKKGGIDLDADYLEFETMGNKVDMSGVAQGMEDVVIENGLVPFIIKIVPVQNLPRLFNAGKAAEEEISRLNSMN